MLNRKPVRRLIPTVTRVTTLLTALLLVFTMAAQQPVPAIYAVGTLDQKEEDPQDGGILIFGANWGAQTFTAGVTGRMDRVDVHLQRFFPGVTGNATVSIYAAAGGVPTGAALSSETINQGDISTLTPGFIAVPLTTTVPVTAGTQYAIVISAPGPNILSWSAAPANPYGAGTRVDSANAGGTWVTGPTEDCLFRTYVEPPTPTPTSTSTPAASPTGTAGPTATVTPTPGGTTNDPNNQDEKPKPDENDRREQQRTNKGGRDDEYTEGNVVEMGTDEQGPFMVIANRDGNMVVRLICGGGCPTIRIGDYVEVDGVKENEQLFYAESVHIAR